MGYKQSGEKDFLIADPVYHSALFEIAKEEIEELNKIIPNIESKFSDLLKIFKKDKILNIIDTG